MSDHTTNPILKRCSKCGKEFPATIEYFHLHQKGRFGLAPQCKSCKRQFYIDHQKQITTRQNEYRLAHLDERRLRDRAYYKLHKEAYKEQNKKRRARQSGANGSHTQKDILAQYKIQHGRCYYCGCKLDKKYHVDHVIPISRGGSNSPDNIVVTCPFCNYSKNDKLPHEWPKGGRLC